MARISTTYQNRRRQETARFLGSLPVPAARTSFTTWQNRSEPAFCELPPLSELMGTAPVNRQDNPPVAVANPNVHPIFGF